MTFGTQVLGCWWPLTLQISGTAEQPSEEPSRGEPCQPPLFWCHGVHLVLWTCHRLPPALHSGSKPPGGCFRPPSGGEGAAAGSGTASKVPLAAEAVFSVSARSWTLALLPERIRCVRRHLYAWWADGWVGTAGFVLMVLYGPDLKQNKAQSAHAESHKGVN